MGKYDINGAKRNGCPNGIAPFLKKVTNNIAARTAAFVREAKKSDHPLRYNEMCASSVVGMALSDISPITMSELYVNRSKKTKDASAGRVDYWCRTVSQAKRKDWLIELKHSYVYRGRKKKHGSLGLKWNAAKKQAEKIKHVYWMEQPQGLALLIVYFYGYAGGDAVLKNWKAEFDAIQKDLCKKDLHWSALWDVSEDKVLSPLEFEEDGDRKSTRLNSSHITISYAVFCLKKKTE